MTVVQVLYSGLGGHSSVVFSLIEADKENEYQHVLIFYGIEEMPQSYVVKCRELGIPFYAVKKKPGLDMEAQKKVTDALKKIQPAVILLHSINLIAPVYRFTKGKNTRLISVEHQPNHLKTKWEWLWSAMGMLVSKKVVYLTDLYAKQMKKHLGVLYIANKVSVINNGINTDLFKPSGELSGETSQIGMLARLSATKDHLTLVEAFSILLDKNKKYSRLRLKIAGDGEMMNQVKGKVEELSMASNVDFVGMIPEHQNPVFLNALTIYVHASLGETMSTSLMQAMACGKAIIASDVEGINNMILPGETGILVPAKNKQALAEKIGLLLEDRNARDVLGKNALRYSQEHFTNHLMFKAYRKLFV